MSSHDEHPIYKHNADSVYLMDILPLPPTDGLGVKINTYEDVPEEPMFDPKVHLQLGRPQTVRLLPDFRTTDEFVKVHSNTSTKFAYSSPFQVLSEEGVRAILEIVLRNEKHSVGPENSRGMKLALRGLYYLSPFIRDFQNCREVRDLFKEVVGEDVIPHCCFSNVPQVNISVNNKNNVPTDPWHWDSVSYTGVMLLNDMTKFVGGELELMTMEKRAGLKILESGKYVKGVHSEVIGYEKPGKMIFAQGSEVLHHVTPVLSNHRRISLIMAYTSANCYRPPKTILQTMIRVDTVHKMAEYEYFREKAWQCSNALKGYAVNIKYTKDGKKLGQYLRVIAEELNRAADCLEEKVDDMIDFFDEVNRKVCRDYKRCNSHNGILNGS